jgi:hypothetical protein
METTGYDAATGGIFALFGLAFFLPLILASIFAVVCHWIVYEKAGQPGWSSLIPLYNIFVLCKIIGKPYTWLLWFFVPIVGWFIIAIQGNVALAKSFGKDTSFAVGLIFLGVIFYAILAFDKSIRYVGPGGNAESLDSQIGSIGKPAF